MTLLVSLNKKNLLSNVNLEELHQLFKTPQDFALLLSLPTHITDLKLFIDSVLKSHFIKFISTPSILCELLDSLTTQDAEIINLIMDLCGTDILFDTAYKQDIASFKKLAQDKKLPVNKTKASFSLAHYAIQSNNFEMLNILSAQQANFHIPNYWGKTPLASAMERDRWDMVAIMLNMNTDDIKKGALTPAQFAARWNQVEMLKCLPKEIYDLDSQSNTVSHIAVMYGSLDVIKQLAENNTDFHKPNAAGKTAVILAIETKQLSLLSYMLKVDSQSLKIKNFTMAHLVAYSGNAELIKSLIECKENMDQADDLGNSPAHYAASMGCLNILKLLAEHKADLNKSNQDHQTPLHLATEARHGSTIDFLGEKFAATSHNAQNDSPIHIACKLGDVSALRTLIEHKANLNPKNIFGQSPAHLAANKNHIEILKLLIEAKADLQQKDFTGKNLIAYAISASKTQDCTNLIALLAENKFDLNEANLNGETLSHVAVQYERHNMADYLLNHDIDFEKPNYENMTAYEYSLKANEQHISCRILSKHHQFGKELNWSCAHYVAENNNIDGINLLVQYKYGMDLVDHEGRSPLHVAAEKGHLPIIEKLLEQKADVTRLDKKGFTPIDYAIINGRINALKMMLQANTSHLPQNHKVLHELIVKSDSPHMIRLLSEMKADFRKADNEGNTTAHIAALHQRNETIKELLRLHIDFNKPNHSGKTPLILALEHGFPENASLLCEMAGADFLLEGSKQNNIFSSKPQYKSFFSSNPYFFVHAFACLGNIQAIKVLAEQKVDLNHRDGSGNTAISLAVVKNHIEVVKELASHGVDFKSANLKGETPLIIAIKNNHWNWSMVSTILNLEGANTQENTCAHYAVKQNNIDLLKQLAEHKYYFNWVDEENLTPAHYAIKNGNMEILKFLISCGIDVDNMKGHCSLVQLATLHNRLDALQILAESKANFNIQDLRGVAPIHNAIESCNLEIIKILAVGKADLDLTNKNGVTPLQLAIMQDDSVTLKSLVDFKADLNKTSENVHRNTCAHLAIYENKLSVMNELSHYKANFNITNQLGLSAFRLALEKQRWDMLVLMLQSIQNKTQINQLDYKLIKKHCSELTEAFIHLAKKMPPDEQKLTLNTLFKKENLLGVIFAKNTDGFRIFSNKNKLSPTFEKISQALNSQDGPGFLLSCQHPDRLR